MSKPENFYEITPKQARFCDAYVENGFDQKKAAEKAGYSKISSESGYGTKILKTYAAKKYISSRVKAALEKAGSTFQWKVDKLCMIAEACAPESAQSKEDVQASGAVAAIAELNRMEGHIAATKTLNLSFASKEGESIIQARDRFIEEMRQRKESEY